jgi:ubiquinone/menaquinone biosynthesis C-methylase UbiE
MNRASVVQMQPAQELVDNYFESLALYWDRIYSDNTLSAQIYQYRRSLALRWLQRLQLPADSRILDVGCGSGCTAVPLAQLGYNVVAMDRVPAMLQLTQENAERSGAASRITTALGDACALQFSENSFAVTIALGLLPWVDCPENVVAELARVTRPGGHLILSADNSWRLNHLLDPLDNPVLAPIRRAVGIQLRRAGIIPSNGGVGVHMHSPLAFDQLLRSGELEKIDHAGVGFGPITMFRRELLPEKASLWLNHRLQVLADRNFPVISHIGIHYLVLVRKPSL